MSLQSTLFSLMLPLRLSLEGFLSYRDRTEFDFSSSRLWILCGPNGAGKSSVFDALRWVIYGAHRAGKQNAELLVHHESARLRVEADLQLGENVFRLVRTLGRDGARPTWQVRQKVGDGWQDVPETAMKTDYERWIAANIGLSDEAFCAAVYLSQGHADAILNPDPQARYDLLSQLVDLRAYEGWHARAEERRALARAAQGEARKRWELAPDPDPEELELARQSARELVSKRDELSARERELEALRGDAARFESWKNSLESLGQNALEKRALIGDEAGIERDFARAAHIERHRPLLEELLRDAERCGELQGELADLQTQLDVAEQSCNEAETAHFSASEQLVQARGAGQKAGEVLAALELESARLAPGEEELARRQILQNELDQNAAKLAALPDQADIPTLSRERDEASDAARGLPAWRRFIGARQTLRETNALLDAGDIRSNELNAQLTLQIVEQNAALSLSQSAGRTWEAAREVETRTKAGFDAARNAKRDFARVEGEARCHFCGQELSPEHARAERQRLESELAQAQQQHARAAAEVRAALVARDEAQIQWETAQKQVAALERDSARVEVKTALGVQKRDDALALAHGAWDELGEARRSVWNDDSFDLALAESRPNESDVARWQARAARLPAWEKLLAQAHRSEREREELRRERERGERDIAPLDAKWRGDAASNWRARWNALTQEQTAAQRAQQQALRDLQSKEKAVDDCAVKQNTTRQKRDELLGRTGPLEGEERALSRQIEASWPSIRAALGEGDSSFSLETLRARSRQWQAEWSAPEASGIARRHAQLQQARGELEQLTGQIAFLERAIEDLPEPARRAPAELQSEISRTRAELESVALQAKQAEHEAARIEREHREKARLGSEMQTREREHDRWNELARLLGPRQLQRHLLREAERAIVREANGVLEAISGGTLRLELRTEGDDATGAKVPKVLDVVCHHLSGSADSRPIFPAFLSGSQRFRVAVALALGIGRTAARGATSHSATRVETILIDEGFGSLDKTGRDEMKDELRLLGRELGRIILVSHQEDFAQGFPARFEVSMLDGVSRAQRIVE